MSAASFPANGEPSLVSVPRKGSPRPYTPACDPGDRWNRP